MLASFDIGEKHFAYAIGTKNELSTWKLFDLREKSHQTVLDSCNVVSKILTDEDWSKCDGVVIEQQMKANVRCQRLSQHVWSWFSVTMPKLKFLKFVPASLKTQFFLGKNALTSRSRKKWSVAKTADILVERNDSKHLNYLNAATKKDDLADAFLQLIAFSS